MACLKRSILAPTNCQVDVYNSGILKCVDGEQHMYAYVAKQTPASSVTYPQANSEDEWDLPIDSQSFH
jgi:hypothetical protein